MVAEYTDGEQTAQFVRGVNLIRGILGTAARYFLHNAHGDVVALTNTNGTVKKRYDYDAFGNEENPSDSDANPFRYCGEYFDKETGTYYLRARYYDPAIGRFTQQDTHWSPANMIYGDNPRKINERQDALGLTTYAYAPEITAIMQSGNLYVYCVNSPLMYCDPSGHDATLTITWISTMWWLALVDGPIPVGDVFYIGGIVVLVLWSLGMAADILDSADFNIESNGLISTPASPQPPKKDDNGRNWKRVNEKYLEKKLKEYGTDPHSLKYDYLGRKANIKLYDIFVDKITGQLAIFEKSTGKLVEITHIFIK